jgi:hypothetical protein
VARDLGSIFSELFADPAATAMVASLAPRQHTDLPTFTLTTSSLRHMHKWFERLQAIDLGVQGSHGNFYSDPAAIGLVDEEHDPPVLTEVGRQLLARRPLLQEDPPRAEYELLRLLYFCGFRHHRRVAKALEAKVGHLYRILRGISPSDERGIFIAEPPLLAILELIGSFPGAVESFTALPGEVLHRFAQLREEEFANLCPRREYGAGLSRLCRRVGSDFRRAADRRLHAILSMSLLTLVRRLPAKGTVPLEAPAPYRNLLSEQDLYQRHSEYTEDLLIWFDGTKFVTTKAVPGRLVKPSSTPMVVGVIVPQSAATGRRSRRRIAGKPRGSTRAEGGKIGFELKDPVAAKRAEDFVERSLLIPQYGEQLVRVGHTPRETEPMVDGFVPGADFYVEDDRGKAEAFIEVKSTSGGPPAQISLTHAEYSRAVRCHATSIPYRLVLVDLNEQRCYESAAVGSWLSSATLDDVVAIVVRVR